MSCMLCVQYGTPRVTEAHEKVGRRIGCFRGYDKIEEKEIARVAVLAVSFQGCCKALTSMSSMSWK